jgi:Domain of unknown function (DUF4430)
MESSNLRVVVNVRIEGKSTTIFEGSVKTKAHDVTTQTGGTHLIDGTNGNENPFPGPTCTAALDDAAKIGKFTIDGYESLYSTAVHLTQNWLLNSPYYPTSFDDFFIKTINGEPSSGSEYWQLALNYKPATVGGGQLLIKDGDSVLWALVSGSSKCLKLKGPRTAKVNVELTITVIDGDSRSPIEGASVGGKTTDQYGQANVKFSSAGTQTLKATFDGFVRSDVLTINVTTWRTSEFSLLWPVYRFLSLYN